MSNLSVSFCSDDLWDAQLSWNADKPRFTDCFLRTLPVYIPSVFLFICGAVQLIYIYPKNSSKNKRKSTIPFCAYNLTKYVVVGTVIAESLVELGLDVSYYLGGNGAYKTITGADLVYSFLNAVTFVSVQLN